MKKLNLISKLLLVTFLMSYWGQVVGQESSTDKDTKYINPLVVIVKDNKDIKTCSSCKVEIYYLNTADKGDSTIALSGIANGIKLKAKMHIRGRSTRNEQKNQFEIKLDKKDKKKLKPNHFLNMKHGGSDWVFNDAGVVDSSLLRNVMAFHVQRKMGEWAPRTKYFEMFIINSDTSKNDAELLTEVAANPSNYYRGVYVLMEKIKGESHRIPITKKEEKNTTDERFILQLNPTEVGKYQTLPNVTLTAQVQVYEPKIKDMKSGDSAYIVDWYLNKWVSNPVAIYTSYAGVYSCEKYKKALYRPCPNDSISNTSTIKTAWEKFRALTDYQSFATYFILNELARDPDGYHRSTFMYKDSIKMHAGPLWDKNKSFGNPVIAEAGNGCGTEISKSILYKDTAGWTYCMNLLGQSPVWWEVLLLDTAFSRIVWNTWQMHYTDTSGILAYDNIVKHIDKESKYLKETGAADRNAKKWYAGVEYSIDQQASTLKKYLKARLTWMDNHLESFLNERSGFTP